MYSKDSQLIIVMFICPQHVIQDLFTAYIGMSHPTFPAKPKSEKMVQIEKGIVFCAKARIMLSISISMELENIS